MNEQKRDFDVVAGTWDDNPGRVELARAVADAIVREIPLREDWRALDYGCGTGLVTLALAPRLGEVVAADSSAGMLEVLAEKLRKAGIGNVTARRLDLTEDDAPDEALDLITSSMTLHHIAEPQVVLGKLAKMLRPGGYLAVADLGQEDGSFHGDMTGVHHRGFGRQERRELLAAAGLHDIRTTVAHHIKRPGGDQPPRQYPVLLTVGRKYVP